MCNVIIFNFCYGGCCKDGKMFMVKGEGGREGGREREERGGVKLTLKGNRD